MVSPDSSITSEQRAACRAALRDLFGSEVHAVESEEGLYESGCPEIPESFSRGRERAGGDKESKMSAWQIASGLGSELLGSAAQAAITPKAQKAAQKFSKHMYRHRYQYAVDDLRKAGLNPILAASAGLGGGSSPVVSPKTIDKPDFSGAAAKAASAKALIDLQKQHTKLMSAQTSKTGAEARVANAEAQAIEDRGLAATRPIPRYIDSLIEIYDMMKDTWSAKGVRRKGKKFRYKLPPDTGRSGYEQRLPRIN